jgi:hypothetical protein
MWGRCVARRMRWPDNSLRRPCDRLETWLTIVLVLAMPSISPWVARQAAQMIYRDVTRTNAWDGEHRAHVTAVVLGTLPRPAAGEDDRPAPVAGLAAARWTGPDGTVHTGTVYVEAGRQAGDTVPIWVDDRGRVATPPARRNPTAAAVVAALIAVYSVAGGLAALRWAICRQLDRHRLRSWQMEWAAVEPVWRRRR